MEIGGVLLGAIALLILDIRKHEKGLKGCCDSITAQKGLYADTWTLALSLVKVEKDLAAVMLEDENDPQWKDPYFLKLWTETLGGHFDAGVRVTQDTLKEIEEILSRVQQFRKRTRQDSFIKASRSAVDEQFWRLGWGLKGKDVLWELINTLRAQNQDLKNICDQRGAFQRTWRPKFRELKSYQDPDLLLARLLAIREVSKTLYGSLAGMSTCCCHRINLRLQFDIDETLEPVLDPKRVSPIAQTGSSPPAIVRSTRFRLIVTKEGKRDGPISQPVRNCSGTCIVISSELESEESGAGILRLKRRMTVESQNEGLPQKRVRFADSQFIETSSSWTVTTSGSGRVLDLEAELETKRLKTTSRFNRQPAGSDGAIITGKQRETTIATPPPKFPEDPTIPKTSIPPQRVAEIDSLCFLMQRLAPENSENHCLGRIKSCDTVRRHLIYRDQPSDLRTPRRMSLETILDEITLHELTFYRDDRLRISLTLSKSLLHLGSFSRSFFQERWRSRDIFFFRALQPPTPTATIGEPYVIPIFDKAPNSIEGEGDANDEALASPARSEQLLSLALTLIEIGFGKRLWKIPSQSKIREKADSIAEYMRAKDILKSTLLEREMGVPFAQVVRRCFFCDFGIDGGDLSKEELQDIFYKRVVVPLEHCLKTHLGGGLPYE
ncbi:hypothetical protein C7212DRAFT_361951 [Tuber magnatum]|uniref:DUF7580 domain-containing protein n=1 Tax=Tuber magnatum TaxID=42249 RepID=A0A317SYS4_9PEZI|nr:hypothetical protein C7212DRAFT_361951 [Tuber magnatum]